MIDELQSSWERAWRKSKKLWDRQQLWSAEFNTFYHIPCWESSSCRKMEASKKMLSDNTSKLKVTSSYLSTTLQPQRLVSFVCAFITHWSTVTGRVHFYRVSRLVNTFFRRSMSDSNTRLATGLPMFWNKFQKKAKILLLGFKMDVSFAVLLINSFSTLCHLISAMIWNAMLEFLMSLECENSLDILMILALIKTIFFIQKTWRNWEIFQEFVDVWKNSWRW